MKDRAGSRVLVSLVERATNSVFYQTILDRESLAGTDFVDDLLEGYEVFLTDSELASELKRLELKTVSHTEISELRFRSVEDDYQPLLVPSNSDLFCMLRIGKPLSAFCMSAQDEEKMVLGEQDFDRFVATGAILKRVTDEKPFKDGVQHILFYLPGNEWRADLYEHLMDHLYSRSWSPHLEKIESFLLGYKDISPNWMEECLEMENQSSSG
jgi:hypothetical protein